MWGWVLFSGEDEPSPKFPTMKNWIARLGQNMQFVAFFAHAGVSAWIARRFHFWPVPLLIVLFAAVKEYWFDARYEKSPPQTFRDNTEDFLGYALGALVGYFL